MTEITSRTVGPQGAKKCLRKAFKKQRPLFLWGPPGIGKSDIIKQLGDELEAHVIDVRLSLWDPTDIKGIPYFDSNDAQMKWAPPSELPSAADARKHKKIILFMDELNSASPAVQAAAYQLVLNRRVGTYELPDNVVMVAAGNREGDKGVTYRMPGPLANRFLHLEMSVDFDDWFEWAAHSEVHPEVLGYVSFFKRDLYDFDPKSSSRAFATPRTWSFVSELLVDDDTDEHTLTDLITGAIGEGLAVKFMAHRKIAGKLPSPEDILAGKVGKIETTQISAMYSLTVAMCYELRAAEDRKDEDFYEKVNNFLLFMMNNFETELVIMGARMALTTYKLHLDPDKIKDFKEFHKRYSKYISAAQ